MMKWRKMVKIDARKVELSWQQTHKQTHKHTLTDRPITIHCAGKLSAQCSYRFRRNICTQW